MWRRYPKIGASTASWTGPTDGLFIVTEKLHGANFSIVASADGALGFASRSGPLAPADDFFGYRRAGLDVGLGARARALRAALAASGVAQHDDALIVYGELLGGCYPHADVPAARDGVGPVQRGVWYSPELVFVGFDVGLCGEDGATRYLDFAAARAAATAAGFLFLSPLLEAPLGACLGADVRFKTRLPAALGLPPLLDEPNWAEGVVVRPVCEPPPGHDRRFVKLKIAEFSEKQYRNDTWRDSRHGIARGGGGSQVGWAEREAVLGYEMAAAVNTNRLESAISKLGAVQPADRAACRALLDAVVQDVEEALVDDGLLSSAAELGERHPCLRRELELLARKLVTKYLRARLIEPEEEV
jgi:Rnl2 family RNA ligase